MIVYFDPDTLVPAHVMHVHPPDYDPTSNGEHFVHHPDDVAIERLHLTRDASGAVGVGAKVDMAITVSATRITLGQSASLAGAPPGAEITINDVAHGTIDDAGEVEIAPDTTGFYAIRFALPGHMDWSTTLEVVAAR